MRPDLDTLLRDDQKRRESNAFAHGLACGIVVGALLAIIAFAAAYWWWPH